MKMKKGMAIVMLFVLLFGICNETRAEEFSIRNGITFGMTVSEVKEAEGNQQLLRDDWEKEEYHNSLRYWYLPIAGIAGSSLEYVFDLNDDLLHEIVYTFEANNTSLTKQHVLDSVRELYRELSKKYGEPLHDGDGEYFPACSNEFFQKILGAQISNSTLIIYTEWLVQYDDYYVVIDLVGYGYGYPHIDTYSYFLAFKMVSNETVAALLEKEESNENERQAQKDRDL